jgi:hypothetical protein
MKLCWLVIWGWMTRSSGLVSTQRTHCEVFSAPSVTSRCGEQLRACLDVDSQRVAGELAGRGKYWPNSCCANLSSIALPIAFVKLRSDLSCPVHETWMCMQFFKIPLHPRPDVTFLKFHSVYPYKSDPKSHHAALTGLFESMALTIP